MRIRKPDWPLVLEAEKEGRTASMTCVAVKNRTELNEKLSAYFRKNVPNYNGGFDEDECENVLYKINEYMKKKKIRKYKQPIDFPYSEGSETYLIPITDNLDLKLLLVDEYYGGGDYSKYIDMSYFIINDRTTAKDVDALIEFIKIF